MKNPITTHVLDQTSGRPANGIRASLEFHDGTGWVSAGGGRADSDGRITNLMPAGAALQVGSYRLTFETGAYQESMGRSTFHPRVTIEFVVDAADQHYHVPLLLSPFGYSTYRGS
jgi:5-hydroxyisourate hydrolase